MPQPIKEAASICKTIMRNGYDAYVINAALQRKILGPPRMPRWRSARIPILPAPKNLFPEVSAGSGDIVKPG